MSIIKQLATYDGSTWTTDDIGANASNVSLTTNVAGQTNVQSALSKIVGTSALTADRAVITGTGGVLSTSTVTNTELSYLSGATSNIQTQINTLNNNLDTTNTNISNLDTLYDSIGAFYTSSWAVSSSVLDTHLVESNVQIPAGTYIVAINAPVMSASCTCHLSSTNQDQLIGTTIRYHIITTGSSICDIIQIPEGKSGKVYLRSDQSASVTYSNLDRGYMRITRIRARAN